MLNVKDGITAWNEEMDAKTSRCQAHSRRSDRNQRRNPTRVTALVLVVATLPSLLKTSNGFSVNHPACNRIECNVRIRQRSLWSLIMPQFQQVMVTQHKQVPTSG